MSNNIAVTDPQVRLGRPKGCLAKQLLLTASFVVLSLGAAHAAPIEYVRVCSAYGTGYFYIPGTEQCANASGMPYRVETEYGTITNTPGAGSTAYGVRSFAYGSSSLAIGVNAWSGGDPTSASPGPGLYGYNSNFPGSAFFNANTTAIGAGAQAGATADGQVNATAIGQGALANAANASAFGQGAHANAENSVALGRGSVATEVNTVSVGTTATGGQRRIVNVAEGVNLTDAVNVGQLNAAIAGIATGGTYNAALAADNAAGAQGASATGENAVATGYGATAAGNGSTAIGQGSQATYTGATAIGAGARAVADPTTAVGFNSTASGNEASAFGAYATASADNTTALGRSATATGVGGTAVGYLANAGGENSIALGQSASAQPANSVAIGAGVSTSRTNQVAIGSGQQTYTLAGITSARSSAAQSGPTNFVTTDANGNLATSSYGPGSIAALDGRVGSLEAAMGALSQYAIDTRKEARRGIAAASATAPVLMPSAPGKTTLSVKAAGYRGEVGAGLTVTHRLDTALPIVLYGSYSNGGGQDHVISGGAGIEF